jgi:hypothetical protein
MSKDIFDASTNVDQLAQPQTADITIEGCDFHIMDVDYNEDIDAKDNDASLVKSAMYLGADVAGATYKIGGSVVLGAAAPVLGNAAQAVCYFSGATGASAAIGTGLTAAIMNPLVLPAAGLAVGTYFALPQIKDSATQMGNIASISFGAVKSFATSIASTAKSGIAGVKSLVSTPAKDGQEQNPNDMAPVEEVKQDNTPTYPIVDDAPNLPVFFNDEATSSDDEVTHDGIEDNNELLEAINTANSYQLPINIFAEGDEIQFIEDMEDYREMFAGYNTLENGKLLMTGEVDGVVRLYSTDYAIIDDYQA